MTIKTKAVHYEKHEIEDGYYIDIRTYPIIDGVNIVTYAGNLSSDIDAELVIGNTSVGFNLNEETRDLIDNIDQLEAVELLALLQAHLSACQ